MRALRIFLLLGAMVIALAPDAGEIRAADIDRGFPHRSFTELPFQYDVFQLRYHLARQLSLQPRLHYGLDFDRLRPPSPHDTEVAEAINAEKMRRFQKERIKTGNAPSPLPAVLYPSKVERTFSGQTDDAPAA